MALNTTTSKIECKHDGDKTDVVVSAVVTVEVIKTYCVLCGEELNERVEC